MANNGQDGADKKKRFEEGKALLQSLGFQLKELVDNMFTVTGRFDSGQAGPSKGMYSINDPDNVMVSSTAIPLSRLQQELKSSAPQVTPKAAPPQETAVPQQQAKQEVQGRASQPIPEEEELSDLTIIGRAIGTAVSFVATDSQSTLDNPKSWPQVDTSLLSPDCEGNGGRVPGKFSWYVDMFRNCIDVRQEPDRVFPTSRFYSKVRQSICYAFAVDRACAPEVKEIRTTLDDLVWQREKDAATEAQLKAAYGYTRVDRRLRSVSEPAVRVNERNSKRLLENGGMKLDLAIVQASDEAVTVVQGEADRIYLVAKGAANFAVTTSIPAGKGYNSPKRVRIEPGQGLDINGLRLERALFEAGRLCRKTYGLARTLDSFHNARMWNLTRDSEVQGKQFTLSILDIGVRGRSAPYRDLGWDNHPEEQYHAHMAKVDKVRLFVALIPDSLDRNPPGVKSLINVVLLQDVHPVENELHIIYLIHHTGSYYSHPVYENVKLVDVDLSLAAVRSIFLSHIKVLMTDKLGQPAGQFSDLEPVNPMQGCGEDVNGRRDVVFRMRGYHNEFWKRVVDPARAGVGTEQEGLFKRWQPFHMHDFSGRQYLAEPLGNFEPHEIHVVNVAKLLTTCSKAVEMLKMSEQFISSSRYFLSGIGSEFNSGAESAPLRHSNYLIQVEVPDDKIRCVIYDFAHLEEVESSNFDPFSERDTLGYFRALNTLNYDGRGYPPVPFVTGVDFGRGRPQPLATYERLSQVETNLVHIQCPVNLVDPLDETRTRLFPFKGVIKEVCFHFVSNVDIEDKVKVGVANLPLSCRAFTVHSRKMCEEMIYKIPKDVPSTFRQGWPVNGKTAPKLNVRGSVWDDREGIKTVAIVDSSRKALSITQPMFHRTSPDDPRSHNVVLVSERFEPENHYYIEHLERNAKVWTVSFNVKTNRNPKNPREEANLSHNLRAISCPVFDVVKGYPVQGFYRNFQLPHLDASYDPIYAAAEAKRRDMGRGSAPSQPWLQPGPVQGWRPPTYDDGSGGSRPGGSGYQRQYPGSQFSIGPVSGSSFEPSPIGITISVASVLSAMGAVQLFLLQ
ncbi:hypothetical protein HDE_03458 [Halotydeus destructor]|nr:hypothetical protein HDE_03458 [Halotydeus destructor]